MRLINTIKTQEMAMKNSRRVTIFPKPLVDSPYHPVLKRFELILEKFNIPITSLQVSFQILQNGIHHLSSIDPNSAEFQAD